MNPFTDIRVGEVTQMDIDNFIEADIRCWIEDRQEPEQMDLFEEDDVRI